MVVVTVARVVSVAVEHQVVQVETIGGQAVEQVDMQEMAGPVQQLQQDRLPQLTAAVVAVVAPVLTLVHTVVPVVA